MGLRRSFTGQIRIALTCADPASGLSEIRTLGATVLDVEYIDDLCLHLSISHWDYRKIETYAARKGWGLRTLQRNGIFWMLLDLLHRPVLILGVASLLLFSLWLPGRILFVQVEGNHAVPTNQILEAAASHGVCLGASGRELRSEQIKNALLDDIPQLQWLGVNAKGCVAVISVRERQETVEEVSLPRVTSLVARADGIIQSVTATQGTPLCKPGDAVIMGQTLISGYSDLGISLHGTRAKGEVFALTRRNLTVITPQIYQARGQCTTQQEKYALLIGNKRINFYKSSGILDASCARIYSVSYMTLPGGFQLPLGFVKEVWLKYDTAPSYMPEYDLADAAQRYLLEQLTDCQILVSQTEVQEDASALTLHGSYVCREMVAQTKIEEN